MRLCPTSIHWGTSDCAAPVSIGGGVRHLRSSTGLEHVHCTRILLGVLLPRSVVCPRAWVERVIRGKHAPEGVQVTCEPNFVGDQRHGREMVDPLLRGQIGHLLHRHGPVVPHHVAVDSGPRLAPPHLLCALPDQVVPGVRGINVHMALAPPQGAAP